MAFVGIWLEAWAVVHNDTGEDWDEVEMTLLSGLPRSYVMSLASPRYQQREGLTLQNDGEMMPQLGAATPDSLLYEWELYGGTGSLGMIGHGSGGGSGLGYGMSSAVSLGRGEAVATAGSSSATSTSSPSRPSRRTSVPAPRPSTRALPGGA